MLDPYVMQPVRQAYVEVVGKLWMGSTAGYTYQLTDADLTSMGEFNRETVGKWLKSHSGDFQLITYFHAVCGEIDLPWEDQDIGLIFQEMVG